MVKVVLIIYTLLTSLAYTALVATFSRQSENIPLAYAAVVLIAATGLIAWGREKISDIDHNKALAKKDDKIDELEAELRQKRAMLHSVKSQVIDVAINVNDAEKLGEVMREMATLLNANVVINNLNLGEDVEALGYLDIVKLNARDKQA